MTPCPMCKAPRVPKNLYAIKPCPFCGHEPKLHNYMPYVSSLDPRFMVYCDNPKCQVRPWVRRALYRNTAIQRWNKRVGIDCFG